jgi:hypothetical protein
VIKRVRLRSLIGICGKIERAYVEVWWGAEADGGGYVPRASKVDILDTCHDGGDTVRVLCHCSGERVEWVSVKCGRQIKNLDVGNVCR